MKEEVVEEKRQFLLQLEEERAHLMEERVTLNILLAAKNMAKERKTAGVDQGYVILSRTMLMPVVQMK